MSFTSPCSSKNLPWSRSVGLQSTNKIKSSQAQSKPVWSSGSSAEWVILMHRAKPNTNTSKQKLPLFIFSWGGSREKRQNKNRKQKTSFVVRRTIWKDEREERSNENKGLFSAARKIRNCMRFARARLPVSVNVIKRGEGKEISWLNDGRR